MKLRFCTKGVCGHAPTTCVQCSVNLHYSTPKKRERSTKLYRPSNAELIQIYSYTMYAEKADISVTTLLMIPVRSSLQNKKKPEANTHTSKCCHIPALQFSSIQFNSVQLKKTVIIPQGQFCFGHGGLVK